MERIKKVIATETKDRLIDLILETAEEDEMTISNLEEVFQEVNSFLKDNAYL